MTSVEAMKELGEIVATLATSHALATERLRAVKDELLQVCIMHEWDEDPEKTQDEFCGLLIVCGRDPEYESAVEFIRRRRREAIEKGRGL
jgi:hypothetical protein